MAFRKRNVGIGRNPQQPGTSAGEPSLSPEAPKAAPGTRPSPLDGRLTTSTGTPSLDALLAGHSGLPLGHSLLIGENGTTDYAGALTKYFAAEGVVQGHTVHVLGVHEGWGRELPGVVEGADAEGRGPSDSSKSQKEKERMKIAWRYEGLGQHGEARRAVDRTPITTPNQTTAPTQEPFSHTFDLTTRLSHPAISKISYHHPTHTPTASPFIACLTRLQHVLQSTSADTIHRLIIPSLLSPAAYPAHASHPSHLLGFMHALRSLTRQYPTRLVVMCTLPLSVYPRTTALVRWLETLADGVLELTPFPHSSSFSAEPTSTSTSSNSSTKDEPRPQGLISIHKLPVFHERGGGGGIGGAAGVVGGGEDLAFTVSRKRFEIRLFCLPPEGGDVDAQKGEKGEAKAMDF